MGSSTVITSSGERKRLSDLAVGDSVLASDGDGGLHFSPVLLFLDRDPDEWRRFVEIRTESGHTLTLTPSHLLYARDSGSEDTSRKTRAGSSNSIEDDASDFDVVYAREIDEGMHVLFLNLEGGFRKGSPHGRV